MQVTSYIASDRLVADTMKRLSICLRSNGFSFSWIAEDGWLLGLGEVQCDWNRPTGELARSLKMFVEEQQIDPLSCHQIQLAVPTEHCVWIPDALYEASRDRQYLRTIYVADKLEGVFHIHSQALGAYMVFDAPVDVVSAFKIVFPGIDVQSQHAMLVNKLLLQQSLQQPLLLMHLRDGSWDCEAFFNGKLLLSNSYSAATKDELLFQSLNVMKVLHLETPNMTLLLCGNVDRELYGFLTHYFPNVKLYTGLPLQPAVPQLQQVHTYRHVLILS